MSGMGLETSLVETGAALLGILLRLVMFAIIAGVLTLPLFYGVLALKVAWFWACDVTSGSAIRRAVAMALKFGLPALSLWATIVSLGYFGAFDYPYRLATGLPSNKLGPVQQAVKERYDKAMRWYGEFRSPALPQDVPVAWARCPDTARELVKLNADELKPPPPPPFEKMFPPSEGGGGPPPGVAGPPETPNAVTARVNEIIRKA